MSLLGFFSFELPTRIEYGVDVIKKLPEELNKLCSKRVMIVTDRGIKNAGLLTSITKLLTKEKFIWDIFDEVEPNPKDYNVQKGAKKTKEFGADCLIAVGGGSPIDCAKAMGVVVTHGGKIRDYEGRDKITGDVIPLIAIPTTAGSGSEVTFSSVITDSSENFKFGLKNPKIAAKVALVDPKMTVTMPPRVTASTGLDALTHAIEGYTAKAAEPLADAMALHAIEYISNHLKTAVFDGENIEARAGMLLGSIMAGIAFSHSDVAAVHAMAEALGGKYDAAHGECNAIILPKIMEYNMDYCKEKYAKVAFAMGIVYDNEEEGAQKAVAAVKKLAEDVNLPPFKDLGVKEEDLEELAVNSAANMCSHDNPRPMGKKEYFEVFKELYQES